jgi:RNA polymerase sigma factor (sigma-70 family)
LGGKKIMADMLWNTEDPIGRARRGDETARYRMLEQHRDYPRRMVAVRLDHPLGPRIDASQNGSVTREDVGRELSDESSTALARFLLTDDTSPSSRPIRQDDVEEIRRVIDALPSRDRELLAMQYLEQLSTTEIAATLGLSEGAVRRRLIRSLIRLRALVRQSQP